MSTINFPPLTQRIAIGQNKNAPYLAFGDDSQYLSLLTFAYVVVPKNNALRVIRNLGRIKRKFKFPPQTPIHCRALFNEHQRKKAGLGHLSDDAPIQILHHCVTLMNEYRLFVRYAYAREAAWKNIWGGADTVELSDSNGNTVEHPVSADPKGILGLLAQACWTYTGNLNGPKAADCQIYVSRDETKTRFIGEQKKQAHNWTVGLSTVEAPDDCWYEIKPALDFGEYGPMFELADIAAYIFCHALHGKRKQLKFVELAERITWWSRSEFHLDADRPLTNETINPFN